MVPRLIGMRAAGTFPMDDLVTTYPAEEINRAVADVTSGAVVKPVLVVVITRLAMSTTGT